MGETGVYILRSIKNGRYYIGSTDNIERRLRQHNTGLVKATTNMKPLALIAFLPCQDLSQARKSEHRLKTYKRRDILNKVVVDRLFPWEYSGPVA